MTRTRIPDDVLDAAHARASARGAKDWAEADRLRAVIEAAGWRVVDRGTDFALSPAAPPDVDEGGRVRYGSSGKVPSRLETAPVGVATIILVASDDAGAFARALAGLRTHAPAEASIVVVADDPSDPQAAELADPGDAAEVVWTSARLGRAAALNAGARRASGPIVICLGATVEPIGDVVSPLVATLADPSIGVVGGWGSITGDLRTFTSARVGDVDVVDGALVAFRRADYAARGPLDERFRTDGPLDTWWSLLLRDEGEGRPPRRAVVLDGLPVIRHEPPEPGPTPDAGRAAKRDFYRVLDRFGSRRDLRHGGA